MENYIKLSTLNDFIFCPKSIYYHNLYYSYEKKLYQEETQIAWSIAHESIDNKTYSTSSFEPQFTWADSILILPFTKVYSSKIGFPYSPSLFGRGLGWGHKKLICVGYR